MYRHQYATSIDISLCKPLEMYASGGILEDEIIAQIDNYKKEHFIKLSNFDISYDLSGGFVYIGFEGRGKIEDLALNLMPFFNFCAKLNVHIKSSAPYYMSWGDYESGAIFFETDEDGDNNKAIITGISVHGDIVVTKIPWQY
jgi:hypothetical protein